MPKPRKVEEPAGAYSARKKAKQSAPKKPPTEPGHVRYADEKTFRAAADKVFRAHDELLRKLAQ